MHRCRQRRCARQHRPGQRVLGGLDAGVLKPEAPDIGLAPGGEQHKVRLDDFARCGRDPDGRSVAGEGGGIDIEPEVDSALAHLLAEHLPQIPVEAAQRELTAVKLGHLGAEALHDAGELAGDVAAAHDHHALRQRRQVEHRIRAHGEPDAADVGHRRPAAGGDDDGLGAVPLVAHGDGVGVEQAARAADVGRARIAQDALVDSPPAGRAQPI